MPASPVRSRAPPCPPSGVKWLARLRAVSSCPVSRGAAKLRAVDPRDSAVAACLHALRSQRCSGANARLLRSGQSRWCWRGYLGSCKLVPSLFLGPPTALQRHANAQSLTTATLLRCCKLVASLIRRSLAALSEASERTIASLSEATRAPANWCLRHCAVRCSAQRDKGRHNSPR